MYHLAQLQHLWFHVICVNPSLLPSIFGVPPLQKQQKKAKWKIAYMTNSLQLCK